MASTSWSSVRDWLAYGAHEPGDPRPGLAHREGGGGPRELPAVAERAPAGLQPVDQPPARGGLRRPHRRERTPVVEVGGTRALRPPLTRRPHDPLPAHRRRTLAAVARRAHRARGAGAGWRPDRQRGEGAGRTAAAHR